jgi:hypothetical protein
VAEDLLLLAARDFRFLLAHGYPRQSSLTLVGNRYALTAASRQLLHRGVFAPVVAVQRRQKLHRLRDLADRPLALDGHNVLITLESALQGIPVVAADDGFIRDIGQVSHSFRITSFTEQVLQRLGRYLAAHDVGPVQVWYDQPMSHSGDLAAATRQLWQECGLIAEARAVPVPERELLVFSGVIDSSDTALIDRVGQLVDVAGEIIRQLSQVRIIALAADAAAGL